MALKIMEVLLMKEIFEKIKIRYYLLVYISIIIILLIKMNGFNNSFDSNYFDLIVNSCMLIYIVCMYIRYRSGRRMDFLPFRRKECIKEMFKVYEFNLTFTVGSLLLLPIIFYFLPKSIVDSISNESPISSISPIITILAGSIMAPIIEELVCRGIIFSRLRLKWGFSKAVLFSSFIFGILHIKVSVIHAFIFGISMCLLFEKYNNIFLPIFVHFLNNLLLIPVTLLSNDSSKTDTLPILTKGEIVVFAIMAAVLIGFSGFWLYKYFKNNWVKNAKAS